MAGLRTDTYDRKVDSNLHEQLLQRCALLEPMKYLPLYLHAVVGDDLRVYRLALL